VKTLKVNGENAQIGYCGELDTWVICSKNVSMMARTVEDLPAYTSEQRYTFASYIAEAWFKHLAILTPKEVNDLKNEIDGYTLIGEFVGKEGCQHIVAYEKESIIFYTIVKNDSYDPSLLPETCTDIFKRYNMLCVPVESKGCVETLEALKIVLSNVFTEVGSGPLATQEEGAVVYLVSRNKETGHEEKVLSLSKLKTFEYRILRKLREKLRSFYTNKSIKAMFEKGEDEAAWNQYAVRLVAFKNEIKDFLQSVNLPHPINFYNDLGDLTFEKAKIEAN
jgi:hypothetical protein